MGLKSIRADVTLKIGDTSYILRPSFAALDAIERRLDVGIPKLLTRMRVGDVRFGDCAVIIEETHRASGDRKPLTLAEAFALVQDNFTEVLGAVSDVIAGAFGPPPEGAAENPPKAT